MLQPHDAPPEEAAAPSTSRQRRHRKRLAGADEEWGPVPILSRHPSLDLGAEGQQERSQKKKRQKVEVAPAERASVTSKSITLLTSSPALARPRGIAHAAVVVPVDAH